MRREPQCHRPSAENRSGGLWGPWVPTARGGEGGSRGGWAAEIQRSLNQLGTPQDSPELRQQLQQKQQYTNQLAKETDKYIKEFGSLPTTPSEQRQRKIQKDRLVAEFTTSLTNFQKVQRQAAEKEKEFVARVRASSRVSGGFPEDSSKERNLVSWESQAQPQVQVQDEEITEDDLRLIQERESSIRQLEADIMDINEIFKDLGMMIHEQGDVIATVDHGVRFQRPIHSFIQYMFIECLLYPDTNLGIGD
ncbi:syntaxin-7 isoform X3 [Mustela putorius furo]|uniref:Syntaxin-7 n=1 Tax=Mustela putorius furo TaxID=9669 RepID=A0A8U0RD23_MUSPF|nr:syntaxin-7 isoform X3 [Mustela putorius furo]